MPLGYPVSSHKRAGDPEKPLAWLGFKPKERAKALGIVEKICQ